MHYVSFDIIYYTDMTYLHWACTSYFTIPSITVVIVSPVKINYITFFWNILSIF